jgi:metal-dependent amidase/aminoacylase/carboxypeptidase family protein
VLTVGEIHGGDTNNVIPDTAYLKGTIRAFGKENRDFIKKRLEEISKGIAATFRASAKVEYTTQCPCLIIDEKLENQVTQYSTELFGSDKIINLGTIAGGAFARNTGSEDFAFVSDLVPTAAVFIATGCVADGFQYNNHHPKAMFDESPLYIGAAVYANTAVEWLKNN